MNSAAEITAACALAVSIAAAFFAWQQTKAAEEQVRIAKQSYEASVDQLSLARQAQQTAEANYKIAVDQLELQKKLVAADNRFSVVLGPDVDQNLESDLSNAQTVAFSLSNGSKNGATYAVAIQSEGIGVYWSEQVAPKMLYALPLDRRPVYVATSGTYRGSFSVWIGQPATPKARIGIYVNGELSAEYKYLYNPTTRTYVYQRT